MIHASDSSPRCTGEPVSWLRLERYHLGEMGAAEGVAIAAHLAACAVCAACLARIEGDDAQALPALARPVATATASPAPRGRAKTAHVPGRIVAWLGGLAAAATLALVFGLRGGRVGPAAGADGRLAGSTTRPEARVKGGAIAFALVRDDGDRIDGAEGVYRDGDRFKAVVTCPPGGHAGFDVVVTESDGAASPLAPAGHPLQPAIDFACGNGVPLPGAFRLTGHAVERVCLVWNEDGPVDRGVPLGAQPALCKRLRPAP